MAAVAVYPPDSSAPSRTTSMVTVSTPRAHTSSRPAASPLGQRRMSSIKVETVSLSVSSSRTATPRLDFSNPQRPSFEVLSSPSRSFRSSSSIPSRENAVKHASIYRSLKPSHRFIALLNTPNIWQRVLADLSYSDFHALAYSNRFMRTCFDRLSDTRACDALDAVLARFVPGCKLGTPSIDSVHIGLRDLQLLMESQSKPLHTYPSDALSELSSLAGNMSSDSPQSQQLVGLASSHSRFVLHLHTRARQEVELDKSAAPNWRTGTRNASLHNGAMKNLPELTFPSPLSYFPNSPSRHPVPRADSSIRITSIASNASTSSSSLRHLSSISSSNSSSSSRPQSIFAKTAQTLTRRSLTRPLPEPRQTSTLYTRSLNARNRAMSSYGVPLALQDDGYLPPPKPPFARSASHRRQQSEPVNDRFEDYSARSGSRSPASRSGSGSSSPSRSSVSSSHNHQHHRSSRMSFIPQPPPVLSPVHHPHDLLSASSPLFAPILRVYIPCTELDPEACQQQLEQAGLWKWVNVGDLVVNLGYVPEIRPPSSRMSSSSADEEEENGNGGGSGPTWLIVDENRRLVRLRDTRTPLQGIVRDATRWIPCPTYFSHVAGMAVNPVHVFGLPPPAGGEGRSRRKSVSPPLPSSDSGLRRRKGEVQAELVKVTSSVPSSLGMGRARVSRFAWTVSFEVVGGSKSRFNSVGWEGEWVIEAEGTPEGKMFLERALALGAEELWAWEVVLEKCDERRMWLKVFS